LAKTDLPATSKYKDAPKTTLKLTNLLKVEPKKEQTSISESRGEDQPYTPEQLQAVWNEFAEQRKKLPGEYQLLTQAYDLRDKTVIIHIHNSVQDMMLNNMRQELSAFVRTKLKNNSIQIVGEIVKEDTNQKILYTPREKFEDLVEKNPILRELKDRLNLDTDY
jgi:DNA polymerase-3 subunit gamma/tau